MTRSNSITLILANDMGQGRDVMRICNLRADDCAVINQPEYFDHIKLYPNETIYAHALASTKLFDELNNQLCDSGNSTINLKIINT